VAGSPRVADALPTFRRCLAATFAAGFLGAAPPVLGADSPATASSATAFVDAQIAAHSGQSGAYVLESSQEALLARAWLADHAAAAIEVQYFIWSTDNIGILAAEALLRAAERGVKVRVLVDDFLLDAPDRWLLAMDEHPAVEIRVYNANSSANLPLAERLWNAASDFRAVNQRMHDKTFLVDGKLAITGGRNMAAEYYDYHYRYNFRDRDVLTAGPVVAEVRANFERFWSSALSTPVATLRGATPMDSASARSVRSELHAYAADPANFAPEVRSAIASSDTAFERLARETTWGRIEFLSDLPGKNDGRSGLGGGGRTTAALAELVDTATGHVVIQSPYLVLSDRALALFRRARDRGVRIRVNTNSLASTDNLQAFAGYRNQRDRLLAMGFEIFEYRPDARTPTETRRRDLVAALPAGAGRAPVFGLHAKSMVVDSKIAFIGTFNLDPRSENLNTEVGVVIHDEALARRLEGAIEEDMGPGNSWNAAADRPDDEVPLAKRARVLLWRTLPIRPLL
jgi:putative cardiolipin synthase